MLSHVHVACIIHLDTHVRVVSLVTNVYSRRCGNRISPSSREWIIIGRQYFLSPRFVRMFLAVLLSPLVLHIRIHIYNETQSRLKQRHIQWRARERRREKEKESARILWSAHVSAALQTVVSPPRRRPISDDRYIIFCTLRAFCGFNLRFPRDPIPSVLPSLDSAFSSPRKKMPTRQSHVRSLTNALCSVLVATRLYTYVYSFASGRYLASSGNRIA